MRVKLTFLLLFFSLCTTKNADAFDRPYCDGQRYRCEHACRERFQPTTFQESKYLRCLYACERVYTQCRLNHPE
jgi:hypothetical protein